MNSASTIDTPIIKKRTGFTIIHRKLQGYVGFANLPNQVHRKSVKKGFQFTCMVVGESGLGKSTMVNTLFNTQLCPTQKEEPHPSDELPQTIKIESVTSDIEENGVHLRLTVVDTPGFGDFINNEDSWKPILNNIQSRYDYYLEQENSIDRKMMSDNRIHACLYFIAPTGHGLKPLDIEVMQHLHSRVNLIPVIAKADTMTEEEIIAFKERILADIEYNQISIYQAPIYEYDDQETLAENRDVMAKMPFAIVGSNKEYQTEQGRMIRGRKYPWGLIEVDNEDHCDFVKLRQMLIRTHMEELKEYTNDVLYENYRSEKLIEMGVRQDDDLCIEISPCSKIKDELMKHNEKINQMEEEMKTVFECQVNENQHRLKETEEELYARHEEMRVNLEKLMFELEDKKNRIKAQTHAKPDKKRKGCVF
ncbi:Septin-domain-containing protein [Pilobolus umbonatus]|nr:Septin-domain-containing protein [Pilobolus umbonatus]